MERSGDPLALSVLFLGDHCHAPVAVLHYRIDPRPANLLLTLRRRIPDEASGWQFEPMVVSSGHRRVLQRESAHQNRLPFRPWQLSQCVDIIAAAINARLWV